jgi:hypothetical protein
MSSEIRLMRSRVFSELGAPLSDVAGPASYGAPTTAGRDSSRRVHVERAAAVREGGTSAYWCTLAESPRMIPGKA